MPISIIILTYNSSYYIKDLLDSIFEKLGDAISAKTIEIVVFDNNSQDSTRKTLKDYEGMVKSQFSAKNLGYAKGINEAVKICNGDLIAVVNPDAALLEFDYEKIIQSFSNNKLGYAGFSILDFNKRPEKNAGKFFNRFSLLLYSLGFESILNLRYDPIKEQSVDYVSGGFIVFKKDIFQKIGGFDEDYFMYVEDMDICYRLHKNGYEVKFLPYAQIKHKGQGSSDRSFAIEQIYKGLLTFYKKNLPNQFEYAKNLLVLKAKLIIFLSIIFGKNELKSSYQNALNTIQ